MLDQQRYLKCVVAFASALVLLSGCATVSHDVRSNLDPSWTRQGDLQRVFVYVETLPEHEDIGAALEEFLPAYLRDCGVQCEAMRDTGLELEPGSHDDAARAFEAEVLLEVKEVPPGEETQAAMTHAVFDVSMYVHPEKTRVWRCSVTGKTYQWMLRTHGDTWHRRKCGENVAAVVASQMAKDGLLSGCPAES